MPLYICLSPTRPDTENYRSRVIISNFCVLNQANPVQLATHNGKSWESPLMLHGN